MSALDKSDSSVKCMFSQAYLISTICVPSNSPDFGPCKAMKTLTSTWQTHFGLWPSPKRSIWPHNSKMQVLPKWKGNDKTGPQMQNVPDQYSYLLVQCMWPARDNWGVRKKATPTAAGAFWWNLSQLLQIKPSACECTIHQWIWSAIHATSNPDTPLNQQNACYSSIKSNCHPPQPSTPLPLTLHQNKSSTIRVTPVTRDSIRCRSIKGFIWYNPTTLKFTSAVIPMVRLPTTHASLTTPSYQIIALQSASTAIHHDERLDS